MIKAPKWAKGAYPTEKGWVRNGELLISTKISKADIEEWYGTEVAPASPEPEQLVQEISIPNLESMTKKQLDEFALDQGIELDRRYSKKTMIQKFKEKLNIMN